MVSGKGVRGRGGEEETEGRESHWVRSRNSDKGQREEGAREGAREVGGRTRGLERTEGGQLEAEGAGIALLVAEGLGGGVAVAVAARGGREEGREGGREMSEWSGLES